jgi:hypothetical protein
MYCGRLFEIEDKIAELPQAERYAQRQKRARPILDAFLAWAKTRNAAPKSALGQALHYLLEQWPRLNCYLDDGRLEISNLDPEDSGTVQILLPWNAPENCKAKRSAKN